MSARQPGLLADIEAFLAEADMAETTFGLGALKDGKVIAQLREGRRLWPETEAKVRAFMAARREQNTAGIPPGGQEAGHPSATPRSSSAGPASTNTDLGEAMGHAETAAVSEAASPATAPAANPLSQPPGPPQGEAERPAKERSTDAKAGRADGPGLGNMSSGPIGASPPPSSDEPNLPDSLRRQAAE
jgi:hypothetical protein